MRALLLAACDRLRAALKVGDDLCDVTADGRPPAFAGQMFLAVHVPEGGGSRNAQRQCLDEEYDLAVTVTLRAPEVPHDRLGRELVAAKADGLWAWADKVRAALHVDYAHLAAANADIGAGENGFVEPLSFLRATYLGVKGADWFLGVPMGDLPEDHAPCGLAVQVSFGRARRVQTIEEQS